MRSIHRSEQPRRPGGRPRSRRDLIAYLLTYLSRTRLAEIVGLSVGDIYFPEGTPRLRIRLRPVIAKGGRIEDVFLPDALVRKFELFWMYKLDRGERLDPLAPVFCNQGRRRISKRRVQVAFRAWQVIAGLGRLYPFHSLRHTAITSVYRASRDLFLA